MKIQDSRVLSLMRAGAVTGVVETPPTLRTPPSYFGGYTQRVSQDHSVLHAAD